jgi:hypothetical protein
MVRSSFLRNGPRDFQLFYFHAKWVPVGPLLPRHGASPGCGWRRQPPDMEGSCEYIEKGSCGLPTRGGPPVGG